MKVNFSSVGLMPDRPLRGSRRKKWMTIAKITPGRPTMKKARRQSSLDSIVMPSGASAPAIGLRLLASEIQPPPTLASSVPM
jgi:hypothetical protein